MRELEKLDIAEEIYTKYMDKVKSAIAWWEKQENINTFDIYIKNRREIIKTEMEWYTRL